MRWKFFLVYARIFVLYELDTKRQKFCKETDIRNANENRIISVSLVKMFFFCEARAHDEKASEKCFVWDDMTFLAFLYFKFFKK